MKIELYDRVLLCDGYQASIVEIFEAGNVFLADMDRLDDTFTEEIKLSDVVRVIKPVGADGRSDR